MTADEIAKKIIDDWMGGGDERDIMGNCDILENSISQALTKYADEKVEEELGKDKSAEYVFAIETLKLHSVELESENERLKKENEELRDNYNESSSIAKKWIAKYQEAEKQLSIMREALVWIKNSPMFGAWSELNKRAEQALKKVEEGK